MTGKGPGLPQVSPESVRTLVVGAGIAGLAGAIALDRRGLEPVVVERYGRVADGVGSWLQVASNGASALDALGLSEAYSRLGDPCTRLRTFDRRNRRTGDMPLGRQSEAGPITRSLRRADLYRMLREEVERRGIPIRLASPVTDVRSGADGVLVTTDRGHRFTAELAVGADGIDSVVHAAVTGAASRRTSDVPELVNIGSVTPPGAVPEEFSAPPGVLEFRFGRDCFVGSVTMDDGSCRWFVNPRISALPVDPRTLAEQPASFWRERLTRLAASDRLPVAALLAASPDPDVWLSHPAPPTPSWGTGRTVLIGDAAHAIAPSSGQGASLALEDAVVLADVAAGGPADPAARLAARRGERVERVTRQGGFLDRTKLFGPAGAVFRDRVFWPLTAAQANLTHHTPVRWMYEWDCRTDD